MLEACLKRLPDTLTAVIIRGNLIDNKVILYCYWQNIVNFGKLCCYRFCWIAVFSSWTKIFSSNRRFMLTKNCALIQQMYRYWLFVNSYYTSTFNIEYGMWLFLCVVLILYCFYMNCKSPVLMFCCSPCSNPAWWFACMRWICHWWGTYVCIELHCQPAVIIWLTLVVAENQKNLQMSVLGVCNCALP